MKLPLEARLAAWDRAEQAATPAPAPKPAAPPRLAVIKPLHDPVALTLAKALRVWAPPPKLNIAEWADAYRMLSPESSAEPGRWITDRAPYQRGIMEALSDPEIEVVTLMTSAQIGKTEIVNNTVGFFVDQDPSPILLLQPTLEMAEAWSKDRLAPMLRDTPRLQGLVKDAKARDSGNTLLHKQFPGGHITMAGANSPASLASRPIRVVLCDEVDRYPASAGTEGDPISLARKRSSTFFNRKLLLTSTPTIKGASRIETSWELSDQRRYWIPCPHCGEFQTLNWKQVVWPEGRPDEAVYGCAACGGAWTDGQKPAALLRGEWRKGAPEVRGHAGFHLSELYSPWRTFGEIARAFLEAKHMGNEALKAWVNTSLGETWDAHQGEEVDPHQLAARRETFTAQAPAGVAVVTAGVDVQGDRLEVAFWGWGLGQESWLLRHEVFYGDPGQDEVWQDLDRMLLEPLAHESGAVLRPAMTFIDSGGHHTDSVYRFVQPRQTRRRMVWAVKGSSVPGKDGLVTPTTAKANRVRLWMIGTTVAKDRLFSRLRLVRPGPGFIHLPDWVDEELLEQLTAERLVLEPDKRTGIKRRSYRKTRERNELLDLTVYAMAALVALQAMDPAFRDLAQVLARLEAPKPVPEQPETPPQPRQPWASGGGLGGGSGWVKSW